ncbi:hypothetical protein CLV67_12633 [Actinoplanes italicus]|uniref:Uncharacterized protein n=1 Tax=Actinoplanes italicus TaxID=113567 RepID=A0A2T0JXJ9_9ACTN|nr:hypothetical protein CLV67_12633 [Actinoplanes italicus]
MLARFRTREVPYKRDSVHANGARVAPGAVLVSCVDQYTATFIEVPTWLSTAILTPTAGSLTPWFGSSS